MAKKQDAAPAIDLMEGVPEELRGDPENTESAGSGGTYLPVARTGMALDAPAPDLNMDGVKPPYLSLVHGTSKELIERFNAGDLVLSKETCVCPKGQKLSAIMLFIDQYQKERVSQAQWEEGLRPRIFKNKDEAKAQGLQTEWIGDTGPDVSPAMDIILLVKRNEGVNPGPFGIDIGVDEGGKPTEWALCMLPVDKTAYRVLINDIANIVRFKLKKSGLYSALWELNTELAPPSRKSTNRPMIIRAKFKAMLDASVVENIRNSVVSVPSSGREPGEEG